MSTRISTITANVTANEQGFSATMQRVRREAELTKQTVARAGGTFGLMTPFSFLGDKMMGGFGGVGALAGQFLPAASAAGAMALAVKSVTDAVDRMRDAVNDIKKKDNDAGTFGLSFGELQTLAVAATHAGSSAEVASQGFGRMLKALQEAADGSKEPVDALAKIGLAVDDLRGLTAYEALLKIADGLDKVQNSALRVKVASDLFGRGAGLDMVDILAGGSAAMARYANEADKMGLALNAGQVNVAKAVKAQRELNELQLQGLGYQRATNPFAVGAQESGIDLVHRAKEAWQDFGDVVVASYGYAAEFFRNGMSFSQTNRAFALRGVEMYQQTVQAMISQQKGQKKTVLEDMLDAEKEKLERNRKIMEEWQAEHEQFMRDLYESSFDMFANQPGMMGGNLPIMFGMSLNDMKRAYEMQQQQREAERALQEINERDLIAADQERRRRDEEMQRKIEEARGRRAPLLEAGTAAAEVAAYLARQQLQGVTIDPGRSATKDPAKLQQDGNKLLERIERNTRPKQGTVVGV